MSADEFDILSSEFKPSDLNMIHLNIRGCRTNFNDFSAFLSLLGIKFSCIALTETNISSDIDANYQLNGYKCENLLSKHGIKLYIKDTLSYSRIENLTIKNKIVECLFIKLNFKYSKDLIVGVIYRPHSSSVHVFNEYLNDYILTKFRPHDSVLLYGDFNINMLQTHTSVPANEFCNLMQTFNLHQGVTEITRYNTLNPGNSSIIDHIWTNFNMPFSTYVLQCGISDHYPILFNSSFVNTLNTKKFTFRDYSEQNFEVFVNNFPELWEHNHLTLSNAAVTFENFSQWLHSILNIYFPLKTKHLGTRKVRNPWINDDILVCIKKRHKFYKQMKEGLITREFYNRYRNLVSFAIKQLKKRYYNNAFIVANKDIRGTWRLINGLLDRRTKGFSIELEVNDATTSDPNVVANCLNNFFSSIAANLHSSLPQPDTISIISLRHKIRFFCVLLESMRFSQ